MIQQCIKLSVFLAAVSLLGCAELNDPNYRSPYDDPYYRDRGYDHYDYDRQREYERNRHERHELDEERERLERERERLEREKNAHRNPPPPPPPPRQQHCPPGFSPSERKCTDKERKHGCQDIRLDSGLGCVKR